MKVLLLNQCFYPDVVSTAQHLTDLAIGLAENGHSVTVVASSRGYDDPALRFKTREIWNNIAIIRLNTLGLGKTTKWRRALDFGSFFGSALMLLFRLPRFDLVIAMTSPPLISFLGALFAQVKGGRFVFWAMDLNPDEAIAAGWLKEKSVAAMVLEGILRYSLKRAERIVVLDRFMRERLIKKGVHDRELAVIPPWSHDDALEFDIEGRREFRRTHGLVDKYVVMYSGNHSPCHPLDSVLDAALKLRENPDVAFCFVGGGSELGKVKAFASDNHLDNITCLSYQPMSKLAGSLSSADLHLVVMGEAFPGIVHPCKIYNILALGLPFLYIGPARSHIGDIISKVGDASMAAGVNHGQVDLIVSEILTGATRFRSGQPHSPSKLAATFSKHKLLARFLSILEPVAVPSPNAFSTVKTDSRSFHTPPFF